MSNQEILTKAIRKAIEGGWKEQGIKWMFQLHELADMSDFDMTNSNNFNVLIFSHSFAKALWGEPNDVKDWTRTGFFLPGTSDPGHEVKLVPWAYHLQWMVIADDPIAYLGANI